jgi:hypothetical protein
VRVEITDELDRWLDRMDAAVAAGDPVARLRKIYILTQFKFLRDLQAPPTAEIEQATKRIKRVRQSRRYPVWRLDHPFDEEVALRLIVWFPPNSKTAVVALLAGDKKRIGDTFYNSVGTRADAAIESWLKQHGHQLDEHDQDGGSDDTEDDDDQKA